MADNEDGGDKASRGNEWEVVSLTASTYAAAPGPDEVEMKDDGKDLCSQDEAETSHALFISKHFVFPPSQHENLPVEPDYSEINDDSGDKDVNSEETHEEVTIPSRKGEETLTLPGLEVSEEFEGMRYFDDKINRLSVRGKQFDEGTTLPAFGLTEKGESMYDPAKYNSFHCETAIDDVTAYDESVLEPEPAEQGSNVSPDLSVSKKSSKENEYNSDLPCGAWWKRRAASLYAHAKEANAFWSVFIAATVMGLVMLGQRWQQERALQLNWQISINEEARSRVLAPIIRLKDVIVGGNRRGYLIKGSSLSES